jgi:hypothetical protein
MLISPDNGNSATLEPYAGNARDSVRCRTQAGTELSLKRLDAQAVKATTSGEIRLELKVSAGGHRE